MRLSWNSVNRFARNIDFKCFSRSQIWPKSLFLFYRPNGCHFCWWQHCAIRSRISRSTKKVSMIFFVGCQNLVLLVKKFGRILAFSSFLAWGALFFFFRFFSSFSFISCSCWICSCAYFGSSLSSCFCCIFSYKAHLYFFLQKHLDLFLQLLSIASCSSYCFKRLFYSVASCLQSHLIFNRIFASIASRFNRISSSIASHLQPHVIFNRIFPSNASFLLSHLAFNRIPLHWLRHHSLVGPLLYPTTPSRHEAHRPPRLESL